MNRMVTKGYRKGVYERVTKGTGAAQRSARILPAVPELALSLSKGRLALGAGAILGAVTVLI
jgi:hypothetical protein